MPLGNKVGQVSFNRSVLAVTFSTPTSSHLVGAEQTVCPLSPVSILLSLSVLHLFMILITTRRRSAPHNHSLQRQPHNRQKISSAESHNTPSALTSLWGGCITFTLLFHHSLPLFCCCSLFSYRLSGKILFALSCKDRGNRE